MLCGIDAAVLSLSLPVAGHPALPHIARLLNGVGVAWFTSRFTAFAYVRHKAVHARA